MKQELEPSNYTFGPHLKANLDIIRKFMRSDRDWFHAVVGDEGSGKTTLAIQICRYLDPTFTNERVVYTAEELQMAIQKAEQYQAILMDEGIETLFARKTMHGSVVDLVQLLAQIRYKNLFFCVNIPDWFLLESYSRGHRVKSICRILNRTEESGQYAFYGRRLIRMIDKDEITKATKYPEPAFIESFSHLQNDPFWEEYTKKREIYHSTNRSAKVWKEKLKKTKLMKKSYTLKDIGIIFGVNKPVVGKWVYNLRLAPKREMFIDIFGQRRLTERGYKQLTKNLENYKQHLKRGRFAKPKALSVKKAKMEMI